MRYVTQPACTAVTHVLHVTIVPGRALTKVRETRSLTGGPFVAPIPGLQSPTRARRLLPAAPLHNRNT